MSTTGLDIGRTFSPTAIGPPVPADPAHSKMHCIRSIRLEKGVSLQSVASRTGEDAASLERQEQELTDLKLSDLHKWREALDVPLSELIVDLDAPVQRPAMERTRIVQLFQTAETIYARSPSLALKRMAHTLVEQLVEIMPELASISPWHRDGSRQLDEDAFEPIADGED